MPDWVRDIALIAATLTMGMMAGVFALYSHTIMRGLGNTDHRTFVAAFQAIDRAIINPWFMASFFGALLFTAGAALANVGRAGLPWIVAALALYCVVFVITIAVHVPLNDAIKTAGDVDGISDLAAVRQRFDEARWTTWNLARTVATLIGTVLLTIALART